MLSLYSKYIHSHALRVKLHRNLIAPFEALFCSHLLFLSHEWALASLVQVQILLVDLNILAICNPHGHDTSKRYRGKIDRKSRAEEYFAGCSYSPWWEETSLTTPGNHDKNLSPPGEGNDYSPGCKWVRSYFVSHSRPLLLLFSLPQRFGDFELWETPRPLKSLFSKKRNVLRCENLREVSISYTDFLSEFFLLRPLSSDEFL